MKILAYLPKYVGHGSNAGAELTAHEMLVALRMRGHHITVLLSTPQVTDGPYVIDGIKVQPYASKRDLLAFAPDYDVIFSHLHSAEQATLVANILGKPSIQYVHNSHQSTHVALSAGPTLTVFNTWWLQEAVAHQGRQIVLHPAVRPSIYAGARGKKVTLVNLWRNKGVHLFWELVARNPGIEFLGVMGGYERQILAAMDNVEIVPNLADIREAYRQTKVILMPSAYESYGRVAIEAAASGIPTIASPTPGLKEALGSDGIYVDAPQTGIPGGQPPEWSETQVEEWEKALKKVLTPSGYGKASKNALARSAEVWTQTEAELRAFCEQVERLVP